MSRCPPDAVPRRSVGSSASLGRDSEQVRGRRRFRDRIRRAVLVDVADGRVLATAVHPYANGVIDERAADRRRPRSSLPPDWALQDPDDYLRVFQTPSRRSCGRAASTPRTSSASASTSRPARCCRPPPTARRCAPLPDLRAEPHAWVKLWKHHAAQPQADRINEVARATGQAWLDRYGGKISSEWFFAKSLQILEEAPEVYARGRPPDRGGGLGRLAADRRRAPQRLHRRLQGDVVQAATASRHATYFAALHPDFADVVDTRMSRDLYELGERAGGLSERAAALDRPAARDRGRGRQRRRPRGRPRGDRHRGRARWS